MNTDAATDDEFIDDEFPNELSRDFAKTMDAIQVRTFESDFADTIDAFKKVEAEFLIRAEGDEFGILEMKRRVAEAILKAAVEKNQPFDICQSCWMELLRLGFTNFDRTCTMTWYFAECCRQNKKAELGLVVLEPVLTEAQRLLADPNVDENAADYYHYELDNLGKLQAKLQAQRA